MMAESIMGDYTAAAVGIVFAIGVLVVILVGGGLLTLSLHFLTKRREDHIGSRNPSDMGILKSSTWPEEYEIRQLPAMEVEPAPEPSERETSGKEPAA